MSEFRDWRPKWYRDFLLKRLPPRAVGAEIGVYRGDFSVRILELNNPSHLYLVDPWRRNPEVSAPTWGRRSDQATLDALYASVTARFQTRPEVEVRRTTSLAFAESLPNESVDWVYLDGDHRESSVFADLRAIWPKLKVGGLLTGDDCDRRWAWFRDGVSRAVDRFAPESTGGVTWLPRRQFLFTKGSNAHEVARRPTQP